MYKNILQDCTPYTIIKSKMYLRGLSTYTYIKVHIWALIT